MSKMTKFYKAEINRTEWEVPERYQSLTPVGSGAYGQVWWVINHLIIAAKSNIYLKNNGKFTCAIFERKKIHTFIYFQQQ